MSDDGDWDDLSDGDLDQMSDDGDLGDLSDGDLGDGNLG
jgi:hypothetical protein